MMGSVIAGGGVLEIKEARERGQVSAMSIIASLLSILVGGLIYILWREHSLLLFTWLDHFSLTPLVCHLRASASPVRSILPYWFFYSLPNALWVFGGTLLFLELWSDDRRAERWCWVSVFLVIGIGAELGQLFGLVPGGFCMTDLLLSILFGMLGIVLHSTFLANRKEMGNVGSVSAC